MMKRGMKGRLIVLLLAVISSILVTLLSCSSKQPKAQLIDGKLRACPGTRNYVSSENAETSARISPLTFQGPPEAAWKRLKETIGDLGGTIQKVQKGYLWASFTSRIYGETAANPWKDS